jgi:hypothetical protein
MGRITIAVALAGFLMPAAGLASAREPGADLDPMITAEREAAGETCALCGRPLMEGGRAFQIKGRWIPLHDDPCQAEFLRNPEALFAQVQPRGALFQEELIQPPALRWGWFLAGSYVLLGLVSAAICGHMAYPRRKSPSFWFAAGLAANVGAIAALLAMARPVEPVPPRLGRIRDTADPAPCPSCGAENHPAAGRCSGCGASLAPAYEPEARKTGSEPHGA